ncbi:MAG TPA: hypothetical protein VJ963_12615 [Bacteroidales bacterium]|nr:hypothetical protein [Bacteroidales bacterium]
MEFKKLEIKEEGSFFKRLLKSPNVRRTVIYAVLGGLVGFLFFYFTEGINMQTIPGSDILRSISFGVFLGVFITNSPCARGRC